MHDLQNVNWGRALLLGLVVGAVLAFVSELLRPRRIADLGYKPQMPAN